MFQDLGWSRQEFGLLAARELLMGAGVVEGMRAHACSFCSGVGIRRCGRHHDLFFVGPAPGSAWRLPICIFLFDSPVSCCIRLKLPARPSGTVLEHGGRSPERSCPPRAASPEGRCRIAKMRFHYKVWLAVRQGVGEHHIEPFCANV